MLVDRFGRCIDYLRISVTDRCNLRCAYCLPGRGVRWLPRQEMLGRSEIVRVVRAGARLGIRKVRLTGGEPLLHPEIEALVADIASIPGIEDLSLTTNGMHLAKHAHPLAGAGLRRVNLSLDTLDPEKFRRITRHGDLARLWDGIHAAEAAGLAPIKLNMVVVGGLNDDELLDFATLTLTHPWHVRFIELMPVGNLDEWGPGFPHPAERYVSVRHMRDRLAGLNLQAQAAPVGSGPARTFRLPGAQGTIGFISPLGDHFCAGCNRLRLTADGCLRSCLLVDGEISLRAALKQPGDDLLEALLRQAVQAKPERHQSLPDRAAQTTRRMAQVGG